MPTIDQLEAAGAAGDADVLLLSQNGVVRKATRAQVVAGMQAVLAVPPGHLLGRSSAGTGAPEAVTLGANLLLAGGTLSAVGTPFEIRSLPPAGLPTGGDLVALGQAGRTLALPYAQFMAGLSGIAGIDASGFAVRSSGGGVSRSLADLVADAVTVEAFGACGDGVTDDTAAFVAAVESGRPLRLGPKTYIVNGQWTIARPNALLMGVAGKTLLRRGAQAGNGAWIAIQADGFRAEGITFDANRAAVSQESWGVLVEPQCTTSDFHRCAFLNATGTTLGCGLVFGASDPAMCLHVVRDCEFAGNAAHGLWVQACAGVLVAECRAHDNAKYGICVDYNDATFRQQVRLVQVVDSRAWANERGIAVGNFNSTNSDPPVWGNAHPDAVDILIAGNTCHDNATYGIAVSGSELIVQGNLLSNNGLAGGGGAGILANVANSRICMNTVSGQSTFGIDVGGSIDSDVTGNLVSGASSGLNCGGTRNLRVDGNVIRDCLSWAVSVQNVETDAAGANFGIACSGLAITNNWISLRDTSAGGIVLRDGPVTVLIARNCFTGGDVNNSLLAQTDSLVVEGNRWLDSPRFVCNPATIDGVEQIVFPDIADTIMITAAPAGVQAMLSVSQFRSAGSIAFVRATAGGAGYSFATVTFGGSGSGALARAVIASGAIIGVVVTAGGNGYGPIGSAVPVTISGDGSGADAVAYAGVPVPEERRLVVRCNCAVRFARSGSWPVQENASGADLTIPANASIAWTGAWNSWRAER